MFILAFEANSVLSCQNGLFYAFQLIVLLQTQTEIVIIRNLVQACSKITQVRFFFLSATRSKMLALSQTSNFQRPLRSSFLDVRNEKTFFFYTIQEKLKIDLYRFLYFIEEGKKYFLYIVLYCYAVKSLVGFWSIVGFSHTTQC